MKFQRIYSPVLVFLLLAASALACNFPGPGPEPADEPPPADSPVQHSDPSLEPDPPDPDPPEPEPVTPPMSSSWLPEGTMALIRSGSWETGRLKAVSGAGVVTDLGLDLYGNSVSSINGLWVASADSPWPASNVLVHNLEDGMTHTVPISADHSLYGMGFDQAEERLAFMELGFAEGTGYIWGIVVVDLSDGTTTRFDSSFAIGDRPAILPGNPISWSYSDEMLLLDTFVPDSEGAWQGIWGVSIPPGTSGSTLDSRLSVEFVDGSSYQAPPVLSRDGSKLLYLNRDYSYVPAGYVVMGYDLVVNELWTMDLDTTTQTNILDISDGTALISSAAWSMDGGSILFGQGTFAGDQAFDTVTYKIHDGSVVSDLGPAAIPSGGYLQGMAWCRPGAALVVMGGSGPGVELQLLDLYFGASSVSLETAESISLMGCVP